MLSVKLKSKPSKQMYHTQYSSLHAARLEEAGARPAAAQLWETSNPGLQLPQQAVNTILGTQKRRSPVRVRPATWDLASEGHPFSPSSSYSGGLQSLGSSGRVLQQPEQVSNCVQEQKQAAAPVIHSWNTDLLEFSVKGTVLSQLRRWLTSALLKTVHFGKSEADRAEPTLSGTGSCKSWHVTHV